MVLRRQHITVLSTHRIMGKLVLEGHHSAYLHVGHPVQWAIRNIKDTHLVRPFGLGVDGGVGLVPWRVDLSADSQEMYIIKLADLYLF